MLGTWSGDQGESWNASASTFLQVHNIAQHARTRTQIIAHNAPRVQYNTRIIAQHSSSNNLFHFNLFAPYFFLATHSVSKHISTCSTLNHSTSVAMATKIDVSNLMMARCWCRFNRLYWYQILILTSRATSVAWAPQRGFQSLALITPPRVRPQSDGQ